MPRAKLVFIGVSTGRSSIMRVFPKWAGLLGLDAEIVGCDLPLRALPPTYRRVLRSLIADPTIKGALVTAHKIDLLTAGRDYFAELDTYATICDEVSCIIKREGQLLGFAKDPLASALALADFLPRDYWSAAERDVLCLGAGGAAIAISVALAQAQKDTGGPRRFLLADILPERLDSMRWLHAKLPRPLPFEYHHSAGAADNDRLLHSLAPGSLVINATGLGKDLPGSPLSAAALFPPDGCIWELNYRGERDFMAQARAQAKSRNLTIEDGWMYFLHGWTQVLAEIFSLQLDDELFKQLGAAAAALRPA